jgi:prepilin-type N-terminal cleavage/methylation domain-containing protein
MKLRMTNDEWRRQPKRTAFRSAATSSFEIRPSQCTRAFTLIELILVMALIVIAVSLIAPHFSSFFRGRALDSEMHQLLALMHDGQSRAVSEGVPMLLWIDEKKSAYGLEEEPGFADKDPQAEEFTLNPDLQIQIVNTGPTIAPAPAVSSRRQQRTCRSAANSFFARRHHRRNQPENYPALQQRWFSRHADAIA